MTVPAPSPTHTCPGACGKDVPVRLFACRTCWSRLPSDIKREIDGRRVGTAAHREGMREALRWYADHPPRSAMRRGAGRPSRA